MRIGGRKRSSNVEDRRGMGGAKAAAGGGIGLVVMVVIALVMGVDPGTVLQMAESGGPAAGPADGSRQGTAPPEGDTAATEVQVVLLSTEETWNELFLQAGATYQEPDLVLFDGSVRSACGIAGSAVGPFYCPADHQIYLDLSFFRELDRRLGAPGDFARAYVIAHEVGHHVQTLQGISERVRTAQQGATQEEANALQVQVELQADCYAGVWAYHANRDGDFIEPGDIEEAMGAAAAIGDDTLQRMTRGQVVPESFTHGTSEQRMRWFRQGFQEGRPEACDTSG